MTRSRLWSLCKTTHPIKFIERKFMLAINRVISFFRDPINQAEKQMEQVTAPTATESQVEQIAAEPAVTETNVERMAREFFKSSFHISLVAIIEKKSNSPMANVTLFERGYGQRASSQVHAGDYLERGVQEFALRFSNARLEIVYA